MGNCSGYDAVKLLARAKFERDSGRPERAVELLTELLILAESDRSLRHQYPYFAAHIELHKAHCALGHEKEAQEYRAKALKLGASPEQLADED